MSLFFLTAGAITGSLYASIRAAGSIKLAAQASDLAVTKLSELQMGLVAVADAGPEPFGDEGPLAQWTWQVTTEPINLQNVLQGPTLKRVEIIIRNASRGYTYRLVQFLPSVSDQGEATAEPALAVP